MRAFSREGKDLNIDDRRILALSGAGQPDRRRKKQQASLSLVVMAISAVAMRCRTKGGQQLRL
ncbi:hypothetical protein SAMN05216344_10583 [Polaromonas sp. OV174]|nr:hypothetical protein SAMN05216344_10583 [Polaromonas sp. OV174]